MEAMDLADEAMVLSLQGRRDQALAAYRNAWGHETSAAFTAISESLGEPTISVLFRSAATLALDAGETREAERLVAFALSKEPPEEIAEELRDLLEQINFKRHLALRGVRLSHAEVQLSLLGPAVGLGQVAREELTERVGHIETLLYRTAERKSKRPFRKHGGKSKELAERMDVYLSVPRAASFAVTLRVGTSAQAEIFGLGEMVLDEVLECFALLSRGAMAELYERIGDEAYFSNFVKVAAYVAPDGKDVTGVGFTASGLGEGPRYVELRRDRNSIRQVLISTSKTAPAEPPKKSEAVAEPANQSKAIKGRLLYADETQPSHEIRVKTEQGAIYRVLVGDGDMVDIVGNLWGKNVSISGRRDDDDVIHLDTIDEDRG